jgi:hypothetical protein
LTPDERLQTAISLGKPDRIPCAPLIESYAGRRAGLSNYEFMYDYNKAEWAFDQLHQEFPNWDLMRSVYFIFHGPALAARYRSYVSFVGRENRPRIPRITDGYL